MASIVDADETEKPDAKAGARYVVHRAKMGDKQNQESKAGRDIGPLPECVNPERREACRLNFRLFCETYFGPAFKLAWSRDHLRVIAKIEEAVLRGSLSAYAMPRGSGKSTISRIAIIWALIYGHRKWACLIGATDDSAKKLLNSIKKDLRWNALLIDDFPEACYPLAMLENEPRRCRGQTLGGRFTLTEWSDDKVVFPTIDGSQCSGSILTVCGLTGNVRGQVDNRPDGSVFRPDLVFLDDPQTRESAGSLKQNRDRIELLNGDVLGLAGPDVSIAGLMACTVIAQGDMADTILDPRKSPEWCGVRTKLVYTFPTNGNFWEEYFRQREEDMAAGGDGAKATAYYRTNRAAMDEGADLPWPERFPPKFASAVESAMVLRNRSPSVFAAEYQNEPLDSAPSDLSIAGPDAIARKVNGYDRGIIPSDAVYLSAYIDVQGELLYWMVCGFAQNFTGYIADYDSYPKQRRHYFTLQDANKTISSVHTGGIEARLTAALTTLTTDLLGREWKQDGGNTMRIGRCLIDAGWGKSTKAIYQFCRQSPHAAVLIPSHGRSVRASNAPMMSWQKKDGEEVGLNWITRKTTERQAPVRHALIDTNFWKSFAHARLAQSIGDPGCVSLFKGEPFHHQMLADQLTAEAPMLVESQGRKVDEWKLPPSKPDNHFLDCYVGCCVGGSMLGASLAEHASAPSRKKKRRTKVVFE
jgi:hypothetical protein